MLDTFVKIIEKYYINIFIKKKNLINIFLYLYDNLYQYILCPCINSKNFINKYINNNNIKI